MAVVVTKRSPDLLLVKAGRAVVKHSASSVILKRASRVVVANHDPDVLLRIGNEFVKDPELASWNMSAVDEGFTNALVTVYDTTTINEPTMLNFGLFLGHDILVLPYSTPDQNNPHDASLEILTSSGNRGKTFSIYWRWKNTANPSPSDWTDTGVDIYIPQLGDEPENEGG